MCGPLRGCTRDGGVDAGGAPSALRAELAGVPGAWRLTLLSRHTPGRRRRAEGSRPRPTPGKPLAEGAGRRSPRLREAARAEPAGPRWAERHPAHPYCIDQRALQPVPRQPPAPLRAPQRRE